MELKTNVHCEGCGHEFGWCEEVWDIGDGLLCEDCLADHIAEMDLTRLAEKLGYDHNEGFEYVEDAPYEMGWL